MKKFIFCTLFFVMHAQSMQFTIDPRLLESINNFSKINIELTARKIWPYCIALPATYAAYKCIERDLWPHDKTLQTSNRYEACKYSAFAAAGWGFLFWYSRQ